MFPYWVLFGYFLVGTIVSRDTSRGVDGRQTLNPLLIFGLLMMTAMVGLRFEVGGDWLAYQRMFRWSGFVDQLSDFIGHDPGYILLNALVKQSGGDIWVVNLFCAAVTVGGLAAMARLQPYPWLKILVAIPYLVIVVGMGYTRQAAALGFVMYGLASLIRHQSILRYTLWIFAAVLFHKTAILALPAVAFVVPRWRLLNLVLLSLAAVGLYFAFVDDQIDRLVKNYIDARYESSGALIRLSMSAVPALVFLLFYKRLGFSDIEMRIWRNFSLCALAALAAFYLSPSSTAVDRIALYLLPMQFVILSRIPGALLDVTLGKLLVASYSAIVLYTWLNFAAHAKYWVPYQFWFAVV